jgi:hypothetical protein
MEMRHAWEWDRTMGRGVEIIAWGRGRLVALAALGR